MPRAAQARLSCETICGSGGWIIQPGDYYTLQVDCSTGGFSAETGPLHPATLSASMPLSVLTGEVPVDTRSQLSFFVHETGEHFSTATDGSLPIDATAMVPDGSCPFDPEDTDGEPGSVGIETEWAVVDSAGSLWIWRHEVVTFGDSEDNAGIRLTQTLTPSGAEGGGTVGLRWQLDHRGADDDGPVMATVTCNPYGVSDSVSVETDLSGSELADFVQLVNNTGSPTIATLVSTTPLDAVSTTATPDRVTYGAWSDLTTAAWGASLSGPTDGPDANSAVLYTFGIDASTGAALAVGESITRSLLLFAAENSDSCASFIEDTTTPEDTGGPGDTGPADDSAIQDPAVEVLGYGGGFASCGRSESAALLVLGVPFLGALRRRRRGADRC